MTWSDFIEASVGWLRLAGEAFWILPDDAMVPFPAARGGNRKLIVARPDRMRHVVTGGELKGWVFTDGSGRQISLTPEQVIHLKQWNPYDQWRGLGQFEAAAMAAESDYLAGRFARNLMANNGDTGPYVVVKSGVASPEQREQLLADLRAKRAAQIRGDFRPIIVGGDIAIEDPKVRTVDAAYLSGRIENRHEIYVAMGVPPSMADVKAAYSIGSASDFYQLILNACLPCGDKICDGLDRVALMFTGQALKSYLDWDEHPVMQEVRKERLNSIDALWTKGMPLAEISEYLSLGLPRFAGDDVGYLPFGVAPTNQILSPTEDPAMGEAQDTDPVQEMVRALKRRTAIVDSICECGCSLAAEDIDTKRDAKEVAQWRDLMAKRRATMKAFEARFNRELMKARAETLRKIESENGKLLRAIGKAVAADFVFSLDGFTKGLTAAMRNVAANALQTAGDQLMKEIGKDDPWKMPPAKALEFLNERENRIAGASESVFEQVKSSIDEGLRNGDTMAELAARVRGEFNNISDSRAWTIAATETSACYGVARQEAMKSAGIKMKRWLTSGNSNVRAAHRIMNGTVVPVDESFLVIDPKSGESDQVQHPGDSNGAAWNVINCHCVSVAEASPE
jgi:SPP1 gp7 family putative phage head morphogenesis protein